MTAVGRLPDTASEPLVSIVTPSLNQARFIEATIHSVRAQDYSRIEHIVVDGASSDGTLPILARHSPPLRWVSERDAGQGSAINRGFSMASGEILSWLNADDVLQPGAVRAVVEAFRADPATMLVYGDGGFVDAAGREIEPFRFVEPFHLRRLIDVHDYILQPAAFVRREALEAVGYVDETLTWSMDWDLWIRIGRRFPVQFLPRPLATVRLHPETKTSRAGLAKLREMYRIVRRHSRRRLPPVLVIHGGGMLCRIAYRVLGRAPLQGRSALQRRSRLPLRLAYRLMDRLIETGQLPWERADPAMRRPVPLPGPPTRPPDAAPPS